MEYKKDIGKMVEETMEHGLKSPKASLWERLDSSLEQREKKRRRALWFWYMGTGILLLLLVGVWGFSNNTIRNNTTVPAVSSEIVNNDETIVTKDEIPNTSSISETNGTAASETTKQRATETNESKKVITTKRNQITENKKSATTPRENISEAEQIADTMTEGEFSVTTKHAYYNSDIDTTVVSTNKRKIDSLVIVNKQRMAIKDSIARARAADSIKLNEAKKDSIPD